MSRTSWRYLVVLLLVSNLLYFFWPRTSVTVPVAGPGVEKLELYQPGESPSSTLAEPLSVDMTVLEPEPEPEPEAVLTRVCWELGPLPGAALAGLRRTVDTQSLDARLLKRAVVDSVVYWVYIDPAVEGRTRVALRQSLKSQGTDSYEIANGELGGMLSLGVFSSRPRAENLVASVAAEGMTVIIYPFEQLRDEFWLVAARSAAVAAGWGADFSAFPHPVSHKSALPDCPF